MPKKIFRKTIILFLTLIAFFTLAYIVFVSFYPSFGASISKIRQTDYGKSKQFKDGKFQNKKNVPKDLSFSETIKLAYSFFTTKTPNGRPKENLNVISLDSTSVANYKGKARMFWFGHSSFLLQINHKTILLDPMFGKVAAPHPLLGENRFYEELPLEIKKIPKIDAVILSHDHYDHLDHESILKIKDKTQHFYVPLGVGAHLEAWKIPSSKITELDWWQETNLDSLTFICTPSQHFSGRKFSTKQSTLWSSWVIQSKDENIYFSGDSGYASHFSEIGNAYGPFDLALMECGQYNEKWADIHMMPEETAQAGMDLKAKKIMPIHWAGFKLALHEWTDPITRVSAKAKELNLPLITPKIGQEIIVKDSISSYSRWWKDL